MSLITSLIISLITTIVFEYVIIKIILKNSQKYIFRNSMLANLITNPPVVYIANLLLAILPSNMIILYFALIIAIEISVVFIEGYVYHILFEFQKKEAIKLSAIANIIAFSLGILLTPIEQIQNLLYLKI